MTTLREFEDALREQNMHMALAILERLRARDRAVRTVRPARRLVGKKMTPDLAREILHLHATTDMTQQEIAFRLNINQGRVNEVIKRGKWLDESPGSEEASDRDAAKRRMRADAPPKRKAKPKLKADGTPVRRPPSAPKRTAQLSLGDL